MSAPALRRHTDSGRYSPIRITPRMSAARTSHQLAEFPPASCPRCARIRYRYSDRNSSKRVASSTCSSSSSWIVRLGFGLTEASSDSPFCSGIDPVSFGCLAHLLDVCPFLRRHQHSIDTYGTGPVRLAFQLARTSRRNASSLRLFVTLGHRGASVSQTTRSSSSGRTVTVTTQSIGRYDQRPSSGFSHRWLLAGNARAVRLQQ